MAGSKLVIVFVVIVLVVILFVAGSRLQSRIKHNDQRMQELEALIEDEQLRTQEIEELRSKVESDEYLERAAKEKLGLIRDGEIIFKENS